MNRREFTKLLATIPLLGLLVKLPKADEDQWREVLVETTKCAHMTKGSTVFDPPVVAGGALIDLYEQVGPYIISDKDGIRMYDSENVITWQISREGTIA